MRIIVEAQGDPPTVYTEADGTVRIHVEGQPESLDIVMTSEQFDAFLGQASKPKPNPGNTPTTK